VTAKGLTPCVYPTVLC